MTSSRNRRSFARTVAALVALGAALPAGASGAAVGRIAAGANAGAIQATVDQFRADLGANNGAGGSFPEGRREINWDGVPDNLAEPNSLPGDFFNVNSPRGAVFGSVGNIGGAHTFRVSADSSNPSSTAVEFGNVDASYPGIFTTFSPQRLFRAVDSNVVTARFFVPGTGIPATVRGFGVVLADADAGNSYLELYAADGTKLSDFGFVASSNGLSFVGISFNAGERIARAEIGVGNTPLGTGQVDGTNGADVVAIDDVIYGEPRPDPSTFRFADAQFAGGEGGSVTVPVVRSGPASASVDFATSDGTAVGGTDYTSSSGTLAFAPGEAVKSITIPLATDDAIEDDETVSLTLSNPLGGSLGSPSTAALSIVDRRPAPTTPPASDPPAPDPPALPTPDTSRPVIVIGRVPSRTTLARFRRRMTVEVTPNEASVLEFELLGSAKRAVLARRGDVTLAAAKLPLAAGKRTVRLRPKRQLVAASRRGFTARLRVTAIDAAGNRTVAVRRIRVTRS
jgi:hypothetical protein